MDPTTAVRTDTLPAIATVVAPGAFASAPYLWASLANAERFKDFADQHEAIAFAAAILLWIVVGLIVESTGSYVEFYWIDRPRPDHREMVERWWQFLRIAWKVEPVGHRYLRRILVSFKFELNMCVASMGALPGIVLLGLRRQLTDFSAFLAFGACAVAAAILFKMAETSAGVLAELRAQLLRGVGEPPFDVDGNPRSASSQPATQ